MSVQATTWVWEYSKSKGNARLVLLAIADAADAHGGNAWPSQETVAHMARVSTRTVRRLVTDLEALGELEVLEHAGGTAHTRDDRRPHLYRLIGMPGQNGRTTLSTRIPAGGQAPRHGRTKSTPRADTAVLRTPSLNTLKNNYPSGGTTVPAVAVPDVPSSPDPDPAEDTMARTKSAKDAPTLFEVEPPPRPEPPFSARTVVAAYVSSYQATHSGQRPTSSTIGQVSSAAKTLIADGTPQDELLAAAVELGKTAFAGLDRQVMIGRRSSRGPSRVDPTGSPTWEGSSEEMRAEADRLAAEDPELAAWLAGVDEQASA
jgi:hypothetical protein